MVLAVSLENSLFNKEKEGAEKELILTTGEGTQRPGRRGQRAAATRRG